MKLVISYEEVKNGDKDYFKLTKHSVDFEVVDNAHFNLTNLFNGNRQLSEYLCLSITYVCCSRIYKHHMSLNSLVCLEIIISDPGYPRLFSCL